MPWLVDFTPEEVRYAMIAVRREASASLAEFERRLNGARREIRGSKPGHDYHDMIGSRLVVAHGTFKRDWADPGVGIRCTGQHVRKSFVCSRNSSRSTESSRKAPAPETSGPSERSCATMVAGSSSS